MMREKLIALAVSLVAYITVVVSAYYLFAYRATRERAVHFVEKNSQSIKVSLADEKRARKRSVRKDRKVRKRVKKRSTKEYLIRKKSRAREGKGPEKR